MILILIRFLLNMVEILLLFRCLRNLIKAEILIKEHYATRHGVLEKVNILKIIFEQLSLYQTS
jgi:hypothetical protein